MKKITMFYLEECPFCQKAKKAMEELMAENPAYQSLIIMQFLLYLLEKKSASNVQSRMILIQSRQTSNVYLMRL